ncbi:acetylglutamate kinase [Staphylospora marina]|uniref:acetylglutamate kinase n=1 Tax=Staphylospora marina TaxID=2490858 RepID=UPI0013DE34D9|nr:acetylglutamate kinase [Staphylospora marina]
MEKAVVVKLGGHAMDRMESRFLEQIARLHAEGTPLVVVHGGGPRLSEFLRERGIVPRFVDGRRVTDEQTLEAARMVLAGDINKRLVSTLLMAGIPAIGLSGVDLSLLRVKPADARLGFVGEVEEVNREALRSMLADGWVPVIASVGADQQGRHYNINADEAAAALAESISAKRLVLVTDVDGIYRTEGAKRIRLSKATLQQLEEGIRNGWITGGMIPKTRAGIRCLRGSVEEVWITGGKSPVLPGEEGTGTCLVREEVKTGEAVSHLHPV